MKHAGRELYRIIEEKRLIKKDLADKIGITPTYFSHLMNKASFDSELLEKVSKAVGVSPGYFFDDWPCDDYRVRDIHNGTVIGDATVNVGSTQEFRIRELESVLKEKERLIQVLLKQSGMDNVVDGI
ncbi:MAG: helix-turn-helix domain-containing protein [Muribaculaceae bacterium]|nr:helix-turn-helix domain-containing protein [Muribaculaceae bacterium]